MGIQRIEYFINQVKTAKPDDVLSVCASEVDYLKSNMELVSVRRALTVYRGAARQVIVDPDKLARVLKGMVLSKNESGQLAERKNKQLSKDLLNQRPIYDIDKHIMIGMGLLDDKSYITNLLGLCALTGRRAAEIGCTAKFEMIKGDPDHLMFSGQLKTKGRGELEAFKIPVLGNPEKIIKALERIRRDKPLFINNTPRFHNACSKELGVRVKKLFPKITEGELAVKDLRSIYAEICYSLEDNQRIAKQKYFSLILGHGEDDNSTGTSYLDFYIK